MAVGPLAGSDAEGSGPSVPKPGWLPTRVPLRGESGRRAPSRSSPQGGREAVIRYQCPLASPCVGKADGGAPCRRNCGAGCCEDALRITRPAVAGCGLAKAWWTGVTRMAIGCSCGGTFRRQRTDASGGGEWQIHSALARLKIRASHPESGTCHCGREKKSKC